MSSVTLSLHHARFSASLYSICERYEGYRSRIGHNACCTQRNSALRPTFDSVKPRTQCYSIAFMNMKDCSIRFESDFSKFAVGECDSASLISSRYSNSICMSDLSQLNKAQYYHTDVTSLSPSVMRTWHFLFFVGICYGFLHLVHIGISGLAHVAWRTQISALRTHRQHHHYTPHYSS